jgi:hypothetical protein
MSRLSRFASLAALAAALSAGAAAARAEESALYIRIALEGDLPAGGRHVAAMIAEADGIWRAHGVRVRLAAPGEGARGDVVLALNFAPPRSTVPRAPRSGFDDIRLGTIQFADDGTPGRSISLSLEAVSAKVRHPATSGSSLVSWPPALAEAAVARALGRVLAHELGHFLLAWPAHTRRGLMRSAFDGRQLAAWDRRGFELDPGMLPRLRARLARLEPREQPLVAVIPLR